MPESEQDIAEAREELTADDFAYVDSRARIAHYDDLRSAPRITQIDPAPTAEYINNLATAVYDQSKASGGLIPYTVIREVSENFIHARFKEIVVSIFDGGNTIRFSDQGPGIPHKEQAQQPGFSSATEPMKHYIRGVGSGLPIVKEYLEFSHGQIAIEDNLDAGSVITISVNARADDTSDAPVAPPGVAPTDTVSPVGVVVPPTTAAATPGGAAAAPFGVAPAAEAALTARAAMSSAQVAPAAEATGTQVAPAVVEVAANIPVAPPVGMGGARVAVSAVEAQGAPVGVTPISAQPFSATPAAPGSPAFDIGSAPVYGAPYENPSYAGAAASAPAYAPATALGVSAFGTASAPATATGAPPGASAYAPAPTPPSAFEPGVPSTAADPLLAALSRTTMPTSAYARQAAYETARTNITTALLSQKEREFLPILLHEESLGVSELSQLTETAVSSTYHMLERLEEEGLVERLPNKKRSLTDLGKSVALRLEK